MAAQVALAGMNPLKFLRETDNTQRDLMVAIAAAADELVKQRLNYLAVQIGKVFGGS